MVNTVSPEGRSRSPLGTWLLIICPTVGIINWIHGIINDNKKRGHEDRREIGWGEQRKVEEVMDDRVKIPCINL